MGIHESIHDKVAVLKISGKLMGGNETKEIPEKIRSLLSDGMTDIVMDLGKVKWMNSTGLGALIESRRLIIEKEGNLKLSAVTEKIKSLLMITQIIQLFDTYETVDRALASFQSSE
ncbi:STAS domain-containing protein [candidate division KSB1 bacterium]|nr:STAS domain-containing protein [candidate division KSB1 bacterium]MCH8285681.1 STAS domain-containing protein [candidate division KSB1 bacterium]